MRKTIAEMMKQGMSLEDIHAQVEEAFNEAYKEREQEKKALEIEAAFDRAAHALTDYLNLVLDEKFGMKEVKESMRRMSMETAAPAPETKAKEMECAAGLTRGVVKPRVEVFYNGVKDEEAEEALQKFLLDMGLVP